MTIPTTQETLEALRLEIDQWVTSGNRPLGLLPTRLEKALTSIFDVLKRRVQRDQVVDEAFVTLGAILINLHNVGYQPERNPSSWSADHRDNVFYTLGQIYAFLDRDVSKRAVKELRLRVN